MASIDRVMALANELKKKKKNKDHEINTNLINSMDLANEIKSGNKNALREYTYDPTYIAPIAVKEEESWVKKIFQAPEVYKDNKEKAKNLLSDGFQLKDAYTMYKEISGDTAKTIGGTVGDLGLGIAKGIANVGEGIGDLATYGIAQVADWTGNDEYADRLRTNASEDIINKAFAKPQGYVNKASVLGDTGDKVAEGIGYMASIWATNVVGGAGAGLLAKGSKATKALNAVDKAAKIKKATDIGSTISQSGLIFSNSAGTNMADIYEEYGTEGVNDGEAWAKSLGSAAIETTTEQLFGMFGKVDSKIVNGLAKRANSALGKVLTRVGGQAGGEWAEEVISYAGNWVWDRVVDAASKGEGATFAKEFSWDEMWEQAGIAALTALSMGGGSTSASIVDNKNANNTWKDAISETSRQQELSAQIETLEDQKAKLEKKMGQQGLTQTEIDSTLTEIQQVEQQISDLKTQAQIAPINTSVQDELTQEQYINELDALQREYLQAPDAHAQTVIQQQIDELQAQAEQQGLTQNTNAQQITNEVEEEAYHLADPQVKQKYSKTVDISKLDVVEQNGGGKRDIQYWVNKIQQDGGVITDPIEVAITDDGKYKIYDGHHRLQAAQELGLKEIPVAFIQEGHYTDVPSEFLNEVSEIGNNTLQEKENVVKYSSLENDSTFLTVAPYYNTQLTNENFESIKNAVDKDFKDIANKFASLFGAKIENVDTNIGGFTFQEGETAGQFVKELSYTFELKTTNTEEADLIASLLGDLGHEQQEAVISANYLDSTSSEADALEFRVNVKNLNGVEEALQRAGINDYTIDTTTNIIKILEFDTDNPDGTIEKLETLAKELGGNYNGAKRTKIQSRYLDREARRSLYQSWLTANGNNQQNRELNNYISEALRKIEETTNKELDNSSFSFGNDLKAQVEEAIAPLQETIEKLTEQVQEKIEGITEQLDTVVNSIEENVAPTRQDIVEQQGQEAFNNITDNEAPIDVDNMSFEDVADEAMWRVESEPTTESKVESPFDERDITEVGKRSVKAYQYENPEVRPYFQEEAQNMLHDLDNTVKGEKTVTQVYNPYTGLYENAEWTGTTRQTTEAIAYLRDNYKYSYAQIRKGLNDIIEDNGKENNAVAKRIEFMLDERLREGYTTSDGIPIPANEDYINFLKEKQVTEYNRERLETLAIDENVPEEVVEETTVNIEPEQTNALEQYEASLQDELSPTVNAEHTVEYEPIDTSFMRESTKKKLENYETLREQYNIDKQNSLNDFNDAIAKKTAEYEGLTNKNTKKANNLLQQIANLEIRKANVQEDYNRRIENVTKRIDSMATQKFEKSERRASQSEIREQLFKDTGIVSESLDHAKNISKVMMHNTDPIRLQEMVFGKELGGKINEIVFQQVKHNTAEKIRFQNKERSEIEELGIKPRSKESAAAQKYGEKQYVDETGQVTKYGDAELKAEFPKVEDQEKIKKAARVIRGKYDTYIDMVNAEITKYGYDPIPKRQDYMRHFQELNDIFSRFGLPFNMQSAQANDLPTDMNGLTADLKPGKNWFASALRRKGVKTTYDAITGIDGYIEGIGNLIYHTGDIQKLRGFEDYIREIYGQEHGFDNLDNLPDAEKAIRMSKIQDNHLGNYAAWVREYTNALAGKKAMVDRAFEDIFGRRIYSTLNEIKSQVGSNMVGLNIGSALTNPISMTQALAKTSKLATVKGYADTVKNIFIKDNFVEQNDFLTSRFGSDILSPTAWQKMRNAGQIFMTGTDWFASNAITRSKFYELKAKGLSDADAHKQAGEFAARILGDRSQGATPTLYNSKMLGLATQFQLEVNNQLYSMFYDTISDAKQNAKTKGTLSAAAGATFVLGQLAAYQHIYNNLYESIAGRRPAFDIIAILATALGIGGDDEEDEEKTAGDRLFEAADMLVDSLPYVSLFTGGGRIPVSEALPIKELFSGKDEYGNDKSRLETLGETIPYYVLPTGYGQLKKTTSGLKMYDEDLPIAGSYTDSGNLRFTAEDDPMSKLQAGIFGQWSSSNAKEYIDSEFKAIDKSNVEELVDLGFDSTEYKKYKEGLNEIKKMELEDGESRATYLFDYINKQDVTEEQKSVMIKNVLSEVETEDLSQLDMSSDEIIDYYKAKTDISQQVAEYTNNKKLLTGDTDSEEYKEAIGSLSNDKKAKIIDTIKNTNLPDDQKAYLYGKYYASDKTLEKVTSSGISFDNYLTYQKDSLSLETSEDKAEYLYNANMSEKAKTVIYETSVLTGFDDEKKYKDYKTVKAAGVDINSWLSYSKQEFKADKNSSGKSISGSRKNKVLKYINSLNLSIPQKAIMLRTEYPSEDKYNKQIINYVSNLSLSREEKVEIFENIGMTVKNNRVYWD